MKISTLVPRLTAPLLMRGDGFPSFGATVRWPPQEVVQDTPKGASHSETSRWDTLRPYTSLMKPGCYNHASQSLETMCQDALNSRVLFIGEQHHQAKVLSAQIQVLYNILTMAKDSQKKVHVVFEHWSLLDQPELSGMNFSSRVRDVEHKEGTSEQGNVPTTDRRTSEGFHHDHYWPLACLTRELGGSVWGGFPPREWAKVVARGQADGIQKPGSSHLEHGERLMEVRKLDIERYELSLAKMENDAEKVIPPMPLAYYSAIKNVSWAHRTYLKSMFSPEERPEVPVQARYERCPPVEDQGFVAAQALKDSFFAHSIAHLLSSDEQCVVVAICGVGHCEWSFGAPERVQQMTSLKPYVIISKPADSGFWPAIEEVSSHFHISDHDDQWQRQQADTIFLYEWVE